MLSRGIVGSRAILLLLGLAEFFRAQSGFEQKLAQAEDLLRRGDLQAAARELRELTRANPGSFVVHNNLGTVYLQLHRYPEACREFEAGVKLNPNSADVQRNLGTCLFLTGAYAKAVAPLARAKTLEPGDLRTRYQLGYSLLMLARLDQAQPDLEFVRRQMPEDEHV